MYSINKLPNVIDIGFTGEKNFRRVEIDMNPWLEETPEGVPGILYTRPKQTEYYRPEVTVENGILTWIVSDSDLGIEEGTGKIQMDMRTDTVIRKSEIRDVHVHRGIMR